MITLLILQENPSDKDLNQGTLVIFNLDPSVSNEEVRQIFGAYGEVKEVRMLLSSFVSLQLSFCLKENVAPHIFLLVFKLMVFDFTCR
jgi:RNA recognition motif-containing protein